MLRDDRDPHWINEIKSLIKKKNAFYRSKRKSINFDYITLDAMTLKVSHAVSISKTKYNVMQLSLMTLKLILRPIGLF